MSRFDIETFDELGEDTGAARALLHLFQLLDAEDWDQLIEHLDEEAQLADELTGSWLRGQDAVAGYFRASRGVITGIHSPLDDVHFVKLGPGLHSASFHMQQSYQLVGRQRRESLTGLVLLRTTPEGWRLLLFDLGISGESRTDAERNTQDTLPVHAAEADYATAVSLGERIKALRVGQGMSLRALADRAKLSPGFLSEVERDLSDPSVGSLLRIADGLQIPASALVATPILSDALVISRARERHHVNLGSTGLSLATIQAPGGVSLRAHLRTYLNPRGGFSTDGEDVEVSDTLLFVLDGVVDIQHSGTTVTLIEGDAVVLARQAPYRVILASDVQATMLVVSTQDEMGSAL